MSCFRAIISPFITEFVLNVTPLCCLDSEISIIPSLDELVIGFADALFIVEDDVVLRAATEVEEEDEDDDDEEEDDDDDEEETKPFVAFAAVTEGTAIDAATFFGAECLAEVTACCASSISLLIFFICSSRSTLVSCGGIREL